MDPYQIEQKYGPMGDLPDTNPKTRFGIKKPRVSSIPPIAILQCGMGMTNGVDKYGLFNWREHDVTASIYYDAAMRHLFAWYEGEKAASDSGVHHLGHAMACMAILLDAEHNGCLNDDRSEHGIDFQAVVDSLTLPDDEKTIADEFEDEDIDYAADLAKRDYLVKPFVKPDQSNTDQSTVVNLVNHDGRKYVVRIPHNRVNDVINLLSKVPSSPFKDPWESV